jgi:hypothetical protein
MKKNLGQIIGKRDATEGTIYFTETCDYLVLEEEGKFVVEGRIDNLEKLEELDFVPEGENNFLLGYFKNIEEALKGITEFEKSQWGKEGQK